MLLGCNAKEHWSISVINTNMISLCGNSGEYEHPQYSTMRTNESSVLTLHIKSYMVNQNTHCRAYHRHLLNAVSQAKLLKMMSLCSPYKLPDFAAILYVYNVRFLLHILALD